MLMHLKTLGLDVRDATFVPPACQVRTTHGVEECEIRGLNIE